MKDDTRRGGLHIGIGIGISAALARHFFKHPIYHAHMEVHMLVQAGAESMDEGDGADVQGSFVYLRRPVAVGR